MFNQILAITIKEIKVMLRDRGALAMLFIMPMAFILVMTVALKGVFEGGTQSHPVYMLVVNQDQGDLAGKVLGDLRQVDGLNLVEELDGQLLTRSNAEDAIIARRYSIALVFPENFTDSILTAAKNPDQEDAAKVSFVTDPTVTTQVLSPVRGMVQSYIERAASIAQGKVQTQQGFAELAASLPAGQAPMIQAMEAEFTKAEDAQQTNLGVDYEVVSPARFQTVRTPTSVEQNVPGYTIYGVFFIMQTIATSIFEEKRDGTFRRLLAAPLSRAAYLIGKTVPYYLVNLVQIALMFAAGVLIFGLNLGHSPLGLVLISLATAAAATGLGMMITSLGKSLEQVGNLSTLLSILLSAVGGMMVPASVMPEFMQKISWLTPHAWALSGFQDIIVRGLGVSDILPVIGILLAFSLGFWVIAAWRFRFE